MIRFNNLSFGYSRKKLLYKNLTLSIESGSIYGLLGKNGAGKSTLLKNMVGTLFPVEGSVTINGMEPKSRKPSFLQTIYYIAEDVYVPALTIKQYQNLFAPFYPLFNKDNFYKYLLEMEVSVDGKLNKLSFGQQKKFVIAFALACNTRVLLMDEPTNGLDIPSKAQFRKLIASVMNEDRIIFISTHQIRDLENMIDKVMIVDNGNLLLHSSIADIAEKLCFKTVAAIPTNVKVLYAEKMLRGTSVIIENVDGEDSALNLEHLFNGITENPTMAKQLFPIK
ncbi:ABC transporter ATP-binding protein [Mucilaginibacter psychrotolerans]|uniref:ABC transporter ATP-binding protein n=1 Tax=Mucilaginibacter psychrotolerans TaxID=1524096 RepID=A0A4Y8SPJ9_9SPHI|nr:ABC transporter ATP-binding protein [Mucilaginibacter psychrotolerans]TFF40848.1 ABC transporter ATP-binding protein [Mucilaginibacter psychrotolerans]